MYAINTRHSPLTRSYDDNDDDESPRRVTDGRDYGDNDCTVIVGSDGVLGFVYDQRSVVVNWSISLSRRP